MFTRFKLIKNYGTVHVCNFTNCISLFPKVYSCFIKNFLYEYMVGLLAIVYMQ